MNDSDINEVTSAIAADDVAMLKEQERDHKSPCDPLQQRIEALEAKRDAMRVERNTWRTRANDRYVWLVIRDRTIHQLHLRIKRLEHELWGKDKSEKRTNGGHRFNCSSTYVGVTECNCDAGGDVQTSVPSVAK